VATISQTWRRTALPLANLDESIKMMARRGLKDRVGRDVEAEFDEGDEIDFGRCRMVVTCQGFFAPSADPCLYSSL